MAAEPIQFNDMTNDDEPDQRPEVYAEGGVVVIRASAIGGCIRNLVAARMGIRPVAFNEVSLRRMNEGVIHEPHIIEELAKDGWAVVDLQALVQLSIADGKILVRGHSDARLAHEARTGERVCEVKTMSKDVFAKWQREGWAGFRRYAWQLSTYMHATGLAGIFVAKDRNSGTIDVTMVDEAPIDLASLKVRAIKIAAATDLPACDPVQFPCQRYFLHDAAYDIDPVTGLEVKKSNLPPAPHEVPAEHVAAFDELARSYAEARDESARADTKRKEVGVLLTRFLEDHGLKKGISSAWTVTDVERSDRRIDQKALRADCPELAEKYTVVSTSRYPSVKAREDKETGKEVAADA